jgi:hypothetical protein
VEVASTSQQPELAAKHVTAISANSAGKRSIRGLLPSSSNLKNLIKLKFR